MKQIRRRIPSTLYSLPLLLFILVLVVLASCLLAVIGFDGVFRATLFNTPRGILLLVFGPLALIIFMALLLFGIMSESPRHNRSNRMAHRVFRSFCLVIFCATIPQAIVTGRFVETALDTWFSASVSESLASASEIADLYIVSRYRSAELVAERYFNGLAIVSYLGKPVEWMSPIRALDPDAASCQVYAVGDDGEGGETWTPIIETGDSARFVPRDRLGEVRDGVFPFQGDVDVVRLGRIVRYGNATYTCVYTSLLTPGFSDRVALITRAREHSGVVDTLKPYLPVMGIWIFMMFCLPAILMVVVISFSLSVRLAEPVLALEEAAARLAEGDSSFRLVPHTKDELANTAIILNSVAESGLARKKADKKTVLRL